MNLDELFKDSVLDNLTELHGVWARRMFGGWGLYCDDLFFGIIHKGALYFKTNEKTRARYVAVGSKPFAPSSKQVLKNYYRVPDEVVDKPRELTQWARESLKWQR